MKLVCTDLDRTLLPNGEQTESPHARPVLWHLLSTHSVGLAYVSGRDLPRVLDAVAEYRLPAPDVIVGDVGASLYTRDGDDWTRNAEWESLSARDWNGHDTFDVKALLQGIEHLQDQDEGRQSRYKRSYYFPETVDQKRLHQTVETCLLDNDIRASIVISHDPEKAVGLLDVLPRTATKADAVSYLQSMYGFSAEEVMFAGDSGNDVSALCAEQRGVLVANADTATRNAVHEQLHRSSQSASTYFARGDLDVAGFDTLNGNYAAGIVEGLLHFRPQWCEHLQDANWLSTALSSSTAMNSECTGRQSA